MRTRRKAIIKSVLVVVSMLIGLFFCFVPFGVGNDQQFVGFARGIKLGADLKGGVYAVYDVSEKESRTDLSNRLDSTVKRLSGILESEGFPESIAKREGDTRIRVEVPDVESPGKLFDLMGRPADMKFRLLETDGNLMQELKMTGKNVKSATYGFQESKHGVSIDFDSVGAKEFGAVTSANIGKLIEILVDDVSVTRATIQSAITGGTTFISGSFTRDSADDLAKKILAGALDVKLKIVSSDVMSASLGSGALFWSIIAGIIIIALIMAFLCAVYRGMGLVASVGLVFYTIFYVILLCFFPWVQLSLPGIAGIILSLGMAVDANVIIFERIKEEYRSGKSVNASIFAGFKKSLWTVLDANITTILAAGVLIVLGTGTVRGFGITLLMGIVLSLITCLLLARGFFSILLGFTKYNNKFYGLSRGADVAEIADVETTKKSFWKKKKVDDGVADDAIAFDDMVRMNKMQEERGDV